MFGSIATELQQFEASLLSLFHTSSSDHSSLSAVDRPITHFLSKLSSHFVHSYRATLLQSVRQLILDAELSTEHVVNVKQLKQSTFNTLPHTTTTTHTEDDFSLEMKDLFQQIVAEFAQQNQVSNCSTIYLNSPFVCDDGITFTH